MIDLVKFQRVHPERWQAAVRHARERRPWLRKVEPGLYRIARRPTKKDDEFRLYFVQITMRNGRPFFYCENRFEEVCDGHWYGGACYHIAAVWRRLEINETRQRNRERQAA